MSDDGIGNGAMFQMAPLRFSSCVAVVTSLVGSAGGLGGLFLPTLLRFARQWTGSYGAGLVALGVVFGASFALLAVGRAWSRLWDASVAERAGLRAREIVLERAA